MTVARARVELDFNPASWIDAPNVKYSVSTNRVYRKCLLTYILTIHSRISLCAECFASIESNFNGSKSSANFARMIL